MIIRKSSLLLLVLMIFMSGCTNTNKASEGSLETNTNSSITNSSTTNSSILNSDNSKNSNVNNVTDPYGNTIYNYLENKTNFPLYAALPSDNIYLYGIRPYGMVLYQDGKGKYFEWPGLTPRAILPQMSYFDYNRDGIKELAVTIYWGSGTGYSQMDLHILNIIASKYKYEYTDNTLSASDIDKWFNMSINAEPSNDDKTINVNFDGQNYVVKFPTDNPDSGAFKGISYGDIVSFKFSENEIIVNIAIGFTFTRWATPSYFGTVEATVHFDNNEFTLDDYKFAVEDRYK